MKKSTKIVLMTALSYLIIEEPNLCEDFMKILAESLSKKDCKKDGIDQES